MIEFRRGGYRATAVGDAIMSFVSCECGLISPGCRCMLAGERCECWKRGGVQARLQESPAAVYNTQTLAHTLTHSHLGSVTRDN